ncbi:probable choline kinase 2 [Tanacetum coccineum]
MKSIGQTWRHFASLSDRADFVATTPNVSLQKGPTLLEPLDNVGERRRASDKPLCLSLYDVYKICGIGTVPVDWLSSSLAVYRNRASASTEGLGGSLVMDSAAKVDAIGSRLPTEATKILHSLASSWDDVVDVDALQVIRLKGAMTNEVYQIKWPTNRERSRKVLVRIYGEGVGVFFDRELEIKTFEFMSKQGQGPRLLGRFSNGRIEEFIRARLNMVESKAKETLDKRNMATRYCACENIDDKMFNYISNDTSEKIDEDAAHKSITKSRV